MSDKMTKDHLSDVLNERGCERPEATYEVQRHIAALEQHVSDLEKSLEAARKGRDEAVSHLADVTEALVGERPVGIMPGTTLEAAKALVRDRDAALADNAAKDNAFAAYVETWGVEHDADPNTSDPCPEDDTCDCTLIVALNKAFGLAHPGAALLDEVTRLRVQVAAGGEEWLELQRALGFPDDGMIRSVLDVRDAVVGRMEAHHAESTQQKTEINDLRESKVLLQRVATVARGLVAMSPDVETVIGPLLEQHRKALVRARNEGLEKAAEYAAAQLSDDAQDEVDAIRALKEPEQ